MLEERGVEADYLRVRGFPFGSEVETFLAEHELVFVVEQNRDAQLRALLVLETPVPKEKLRSVLAYGGFPLQAAQVVTAIEAQIGAGGEGRPSQSGRLPAGDNVQNLVSRPRGREARR